VSLLFLLGCSASSSTPETHPSGGTGTGSGGTGSANAGTGTSLQGGSGTEQGGGTALGNGGSSTGAGGSSNTNGGSASGGMATANGGATNGSGGSSTGSGGAVSSAGMTGAGGSACQMAKYNFEPKIPTVYVMVDRSGSMFDCLSTTNPEPSCKTQDDTAWVKLKNAALSVIDSLEGQVRFGFASFTGTNPQNGGMCPMIDQVAPALNNFTPIKTLYDSLPFQPETTESGKKFETPARQSLDMIGAKLLADTAPGDKYILFVTDGQPDYCDDANTLCAPDSVIAGLQALNAKGVVTIVMGLQSAANDLPPGILQAFANAGRGEATVAPVRANQTAFSFYDECNGVAGWHADLVASGKTAVRGVTLGTYSDAAGPTKPYTPNSSDQAALVSQLGTALAGVKSCTFDLSNVNGQSIKVDLNNLAAASVSIEGTMVPQNDTTGWSMASASQLVLNGAACDNWRKPNNNKIDFNFPCSTIIFE
jgi:hypothetical protein